MLNAETLRSALSYNPSTGAFTWIGFRSGANPAKEAGNTRPDGYKRIRIDGQSYLAHRLAWLHVYGEWPRQSLDHIDGDPSNNRIANLRDVATQANVQNIKKATRANTSSGLLGVSYHKRDGLWRARIMTDGKSVCIGYFKDPGDAHQAYLNAKRLRHQGNML